MWIRLQSMNRCRCENKVFKLVPAFPSWIGKLTNCLLKSLGPSVSCGQILQFDNIQLLFHKQKPTGTLTLSIGRRLVWLCGRFFWGTCLWTLSSVETASRTHTYTSLGALKTEVKMAHLFMPDFIKGQVFVQVGVESKVNVSRNQVMHRLVNQFLYI